MKESCRERLILTAQVSRLLAKKYRAQIKLWKVNVV